MPEMTIVRRREQHEHEDHRHRGGEVHDPVAPETLEGLAEGEVQEAHEDSGRRIDSVLAVVAADLVANDASVLEGHDATTQRGHDLGVVRGHEHGRAQLVDAEQELDDLPAR